MTEQLRPLLLNNIKLIRKDALVLDLGCGEGYDALTLARQGYSIEAVDQSAEAIAQLQLKIQQEQLKTIQVHCQEITTFPFVKQYGTILSFATLHFLTVPQRKKLIQEMQKNTLKQGVHFLAVFTQTGDLDPGTTLHFFADEELLTYYKGWSVISYVKTLKSTKQKDENGNQKQHEVAFLAVQKS